MYNSHGLKTGECGGEKYVLMIFSHKSLAGIKNGCIFALVISRGGVLRKGLFNGVMVAQQILVLFVQVRILVEQPKGFEIHFSNLFCMFPFGCDKKTGSYLCVTDNCLNHALRTMCPLGLVLFFQYYIVCATFYDAG